MDVIDFSNTPNLIEFFSFFLFSCHCLIVSSLNSSDEIVSGGIDLVLKVIYSTVERWFSKWFAND